MSDVPQSLPTGGLAATRANEDAGVREFLGFVVGAEAYALPLSSIREIVRVPAITEVPRAPAEVLGIMSVRGRVTTLIDMRRRLAVVESPVGPRARVLLVEHHDELIGLLVDRVLHVYRLGAAEIELASVLGRDPGSHVVGLGRPGRHRTEAEASEPHPILILLDSIALLRPVGGY